MGNWNAAILGGDTEVEFLQRFAQKIGVPVSADEFARRVIEDFSDSCDVLNAVNSDVFRARLEAISDDELHRLLSEWGDSDSCLMPAASLYMAAGARLPAFLKESCLFWCDKPTHPVDDEDEAEFEYRASTWLSDWSQPDVRQAQLTAFAELLRSYSGNPLNVETLSGLVQGLGKNGAAITLETLPVE